MAESAAGMICSGRATLSQYLDTGRKQSLTVRLPSCGVSSCCKTGSGPREAKTSPGNSSTGSRFMVDRAAPVIMLVAPGPIEEVHAKAERRFFILAKPAAVCTIPCSLRA
jgi:hypothetical protein